jgi:hypothetical protein
VDALPEPTKQVFARLLRRLEHKRVAAVAEPLLRELGRRLPRPAGGMLPPTASETIVVVGSGMDPDTDTSPDGSEPDAADVTDVADPATLIDVVG